MKTVTLADMLERAMEDRGLNKSEAAIAVGVSRQAFTLWLKGAYDPKLTPDKLANIAEFTGQKREDVLRAMGFLDPRGYFPLAA